MFGVLQDKGRSRGCCRKLCQHHLSETGIFSRKRGHSIRTMSPSSKHLPWDETATIPCSPQLSPHAPTIFSSPRTPARLHSSWHSLLRLLVSSGCGYIPQIITPSLLPPYLSLLTWGLCNPLLLLSLSISLYIRHSPRNRWPQQGVPWP